MKQNKLKIEIEVQICVVGMICSGKTSIIKRFTENGFSEHEPATPHNYCIDKIIETDKYKIKLSIFDTMGQDKFWSVNKVYIKNVDGIIFVCDKTKASSLIDVQAKINDCDSCIADYVGIICASKKDLYLEEEIYEKDLLSFGEKNYMKVFETSALNDKYSIEKVFMELTLQILKKNENYEIVDNFYKKFGGLYDLKEYNNYYITLIGSNKYLKFDIIERYSFKELKMNKYKIKLIINDIDKFDNFDSKKKELRRIDGFIFIIDSCSKESLEEIKKWKIDNDRLIIGHKKIIFADESEVKNGRPNLIKEIYNYASNQNIKVSEINSKTWKNIDKIFMEFIVQILLKQRNKDLIAEFSDEYIAKELFKNLNKYVNY